MIKYVLPTQHEKEMHLLEIIFFIWSNIGMLRNSKSPPYIKNKKA